MFYVRLGILGLDFKAEYRDSERGISHILAHELGHVYDYIKKDSLSKSWKNTPELLEEFKEIAKNTKSTFAKYTVDYPL